MAYTNLPPNLYDYFSTINQRIRKLESAPDQAMTTATSAQGTASNASTQAIAAEAQATTALANAAVAYSAAIGSLQPSASTIVNASNQMTAISTNGITVYSGSSPSSGARVVMNSTGIAGYNSSGSATFAINASTGAASFAGSITGSTITGSTLNISGNFIVDGSGLLTCTGADVTGKITGTSGSFTGSVYASSGTIAGFTLNSAAFSTASGMTISSSTGQIITPSSITAGTTLQAGGQISNTAGGAVFYGGLDVATGSATIAGNLMVASMSSTAATTVVWSSSNNRFYLSSSSGRFKTNINPVPNADYLSLLLKLEPVTFNYLPEYTDNPTLLVSGLIAEKVAEIPEFNTVVNYDKDNLPESIAYDRLAVFILPALQQLNTRLAKLEGANGTTTSN